ncbi:hypothetical protein OH77DRAFT_1517922 [Trametes cingulata]|nr:hypothetical protein OH77DRAFT_1517922 [Trametes cingulata]
MIPFVQHPSALFGADPPAGTPRGGGAAPHSTGLIIGLCVGLGVGAVIVTAFIFRRRSPVSRKELPSSSSLHDLEALPGLQASGPSNAQGTAAEAGTPSGREPPLPSYPSAQRIPTHVPEAPPVPTDSLGTPNTQVAGSADVHSSPSSDPTGQLKSYAPAGSRSPQDEDSPSQVSSAAATYGPPAEDIVDAARRTMAQGERVRLRKEEWPAHTHPVDTPDVRPILRDAEMLVQQNTAIATQDVTSMGQEQQPSARSTRRRTREVIVQAPETGLQEGLPRRRLITVLMSEVDDDINREDDEPPPYEPQHVLGTTNIVNWTCQTSPFAEFAILLESWPAFDGPVMLVENQKNADCTATFNITSELLAPFLRNPGEVPLDGYSVALAELDPQTSEPIFIYAESQDFELRPAGSSLP